MNEQPIGIFDSGIGGLTVVREIRRLLPTESLIYFGDTGRVPYGNKSKQTITEYALQITDFLIEKRIKALVIACNTATAYAYDEVKAHVEIPVIGVVTPGAIAAVKRSKTGRIGVIGTSGTINSRAYQAAIQSLNASAQVFTQATPLLVPIVEEGWVEHPAAGLIIREYMKPLSNERIDTLVLGCTHYPLLKNSLRRETFDSIELVDSGEETAALLKKTLLDHQLLNKGKKPGSLSFFVSDLNLRYKELGRRFLELPFENVTRIDWLARG